MPQLTLVVMRLILQTTAIRVQHLDQVRVDQGKERVLTLYMQEILAHLHRNTNQAPHDHLQTTSKLVNQM